MSEIDSRSVVLDSQVWLRGLLAKDPDSIGSTLLRAARDREFRCVGSSALIYEVAAKLRLPRIAKRLERGEAEEAQSLVIALLDPVVAIDGIRMGCEDPEDDHILEAAVKGNASYVVTRDEKLLNLPEDVQSRLALEHDVIVVPDWAFCRWYREKNEDSYRMWAVALN